MPASVPPPAPAFAPAASLEPDKRVASRGKEPSRLKTHWDYLLEEMAWLAKDFESERKLKLSQAKKVAVKVSKSGLSTEAKGQRRQKEEEHRIRRIAGSIAKDVKKFWTKIEKMVIYKHHIEVEGRKKKALDKHLDFLVGQTERYSTMLAEIWAEPENRPLLIQPSSTSNDGKITDGALKQGLLQLKQHSFPSDRIDSSEATREGQLLTNNVDVHNIEEPRQMNSDAEGSKQTHSTSAGKKQMESTESLQQQIQSVHVNRESGMLSGFSSDKIRDTVGETLQQHTDSALVPVMKNRSENERARLKTEKEDEDAEFSLENTEEVEDDFSTLEADEALITEDERREELLALEREGSLPLEELLKLYSSRADLDGSGSEEEEEQQQQQQQQQQEQQQQEEEEEEEEEGADVSEQGDHVSELSEDEETHVQLQKETPASNFPNQKSEATECNKFKDEETCGYNIVDAAAAAQSAQPTGFTFSTTKVHTKLPFLLKHSLREYQHIGLDWLVTMYERRLNGILADEMGLGKTIMTIALLAHLACDKGIWGPHLIVVPTSVMLNWEMEFMKWCPAFKILTYFGSAKERKVKRQGWSKSNSFHVCITTYRLVIQDAKAFKRKKWKYLILDEAHLIKNWKSQRWQTLLNFNSKRRILLTGTPLQNDLMELWSLMHFLMPHLFQSHQEFRDWFNNPITGMIEGQEQMNKEIVDRLHIVLRPFILRRLKQDVEKQLPKKYEHVIRCRLSKRQRNLYEDFMASSDTQATLSSGNFLGLINVLMQLRKVCNHPDLFEGRPIVSSFDMPGIDLHLSTAVSSALGGVSIMLTLVKWSLLLTQLEFEMSAWEANEVRRIATPASLIEEIGSSGEDGWDAQSGEHKSESIIDEIQKALNQERRQKQRQKLAAFGQLSALWCNRAPIYGLDFRKQVSIEHPVYDVHRIKADPFRYMEVASSLADLVQLPSTRYQKLMDLLQAFVFAIPAVRSPPPVAWCSHPSTSSMYFKSEFYEDCKNRVSPLLAYLRPVLVRRQLFFPDRRLLQFDCGKLQELAVLLRRLKSAGHRALIFTQMTRMLDVLESFVNLHGYTYLRLDGSTKPEERQILMQRFNTNPKIFLFILSTRSGGVGVNLVGADTVIFYDSDWNPAMDQQAQDRCHRIGQTREVHIYRLISESTIEENILKKANQKRILDDLVIQRGSYDTEYFKKLDPVELLSGLKGVKIGARGVSESASDTAGSVQGSMQELSNLEVEAALKSAEDEADYMALIKVEQEEAAENQEFTEEGYSGNMDEDDCADDLDEGKAPSEKGRQALDGLGGTHKPEADISLPVIDSTEVAGIDADLNEDMDMLADVKQMAAAAAAAGHGSVSFDAHLCPAERYAMRFLELWDPRVDKDAIEMQVAFEETEWELDQLERLKQEQEAEIDEDDEPLVYESWNTLSADEAYRQQVEVLAQQEYEQQREWERMEEEMLDAERVEAEAAAALGISAFELKNKLRKAKFKSLKKGPLTARGEAALDLEADSSFDADWQSRDMLCLSLPYRGPSQRKRKIPRLFEEEMLAEIYKKRIRKDLILSYRSLAFEGEPDELGAGDPDSVVMLLDSSFPDHSKKTNLGGMPYFGMPLKKGPLVTLEKEKKKDGLRAGDPIPPADPWMPLEDAIFCAVVHEYGGNWLLASETLAGIPDGGVFRGRYRHPVHCRERFRQLLAKYTSITATRELAVEKGGSSSANNVQLKVTEEHIKQLLEAVQCLPDDEWLLQRHFIAVLTSVGLRGGQAFKGHKNAFLKSGSSPHVPPFIPVPKGSSISSTLPAKVSMAENRSSPTFGFVATALAQLDSEDERVREDQNNATELMTSCNHQDFVNESSGSGKDHLTIAVDFLETANQPHDREFPEHILITIPGPVSASNSHHRMDPAYANAFRRFSKSLIEQRYRMACKMSTEGEVQQWAAAAGMGLGIVGGSNSKIQNSGKRRLVLEPGKASWQKKRRLSKAKDSDKTTEINLESRIVDVSSLNLENKPDDTSTVHIESDACDAIEVNAAATLRTISQAISERQNVSYDESLARSPSTLKKHSCASTSAQMSGCILNCSSHEERWSDGSGSQASLWPNERVLPMATPKFPPQSGVSVPGVGGSSEVLRRLESNDVTFRENVGVVAALDHRGQHHDSSAHMLDCPIMEDAARRVLDIQVSDSGMFQTVSDSKVPQATASERVLAEVTPSVERQPGILSSPASELEIVVPQVFPNTFLSLSGTPSAQ